MKIINGISEEEAFKKFKRQLSEMDDTEFFHTLGTSIEELREKQRLDTEHDDCINSSFIIFKSNFDFKYLTHDATTVSKCICASISSCDYFESDQATFAA